MKCECKCDVCKSACGNKPGWFAPGEVEEAAKLKGLTKEEFFNKYLMIDYWTEDWEFDDDVFGLSPVTHVGTAGNVSPRNPKGQCIFYEDGLCQIHEAKPKECSNMHHDTSHKDHMEIKRGIVREWVKRQDEITKLYGKEPVSSGDWSIFDEWGMG